MAQRGDFGYGAVREYRDDPTGSPRGGPGYRDNAGPRQGGYQGNDGYSSYNELVDKISSNIFTINNNATSLDRGAKQIGTVRDSLPLRDRIHDTEQTTNRVITDTVSALRQLSTVARQADRSKKLQNERLTNEFKEALERYNSLQKKVAEQVRAAVPLSQPPTTTTTTKSRSKPSDLIGWGDNDDDDAQLIRDDERRQQLQAQEEAIDIDLELIRDREERVRQLESDILDINEIFRDLGSMVHEQGEVIDSIENNVEKAYDNVEAGAGQLEQAAEYQRRARKKKCILVIVLLVVAGIIALIIYLSVRNK